MSEQQSQPQRPTRDDDREETHDELIFRAYRMLQGTHPRTEPEIDAARQAYLAERRAIKPDIVRGIYPFKDVEPKLTRADIEWLLKTHDGGRGPVVWDEEKDKPDDERCVGLDLRGADLRLADLAGLPLACVCGGVTSQEALRASDEQKEAAAVHLEGAQLYYAHLEGATLHEAHLEQPPLTLRRDAL
jgi:hypothetical protein